MRTSANNLTDQNWFAKYMVGLGRVCRSGPFPSEHEMQMQAVCELTPARRGKPARYHSMDLQHVTDPYSIVAIWEPMDDSETVAAETFQPAFLGD